MEKSPLAGFEPPPARLCSLSVQRSTTVLLERCVCVCVCLEFYFTMLRKFLDIHPCLILQFPKVTWDESDRQKEVGVLSEIVKG